MDLSRVIIGPVVTEKAERLKAGSASGSGQTYTVTIAPQATKIDVKNAIRQYYQVNVKSVRIVKVQPKTRLFGAGSTMEKRHPSKRALITLTKDSKPLDLSAFQVLAS